MAGTQSRRYTIYIDNQEAQRNLDSLKERAHKLTDEISRIQAAGGNATRQMQQLGNTQQQISSLETSIRSGLTRSLRDLQGEVSRTESLLRRATDPEIIRQLNAQLVIARQNLLAYRAGVLGIESAQRQLAAQSANVFTRLGDGIKASLFGNLLSNGITTLLTSVKEAIKSSIDLALKAEGVTTAFNKLDNPTLLQTLRTATKGTVSDLELMKKAVSADQFQIPLKNLGTYLEFAHDRARATGQSVDYLAESIVLGIARKSPLILDNLGINIQRINTEFQKTGDFASAATKIIEEEMAKAGKAVDTNADRVDRWAVRWENAKLRVGNAVLTVSDDISLQFESWFGDEETKKKADEAMFQNFIDRQDAVKEFRERELGALQLFQQRYGDGTKKGDKELMEIMRESIAGTEKLQKEAQDQSNHVLAKQLSIRLDIWNGYFRSLGIGTEQAVNKNTLAGMNKELSMLTDMLQTLDIKSEKFASTQAAIKKLQKEIDDASGKTAEKVSNKAIQTAEQAKRKQEQLDKQLADLRVKVFGDTLTGYEKEILASQHKFDELKKQLTKYGVDTKELEDLHNKDILQIYERHFRDLEKEFSKGRDLTKTERKQMQEKVVAGTGSAVIRSADYLLGQAQKNNEDDISARRYELSKATLEMRLKAQLALLDAERRQELTSTEVTERQRAEIEEMYRKTRQEAEIEYYAQLVGIASSFVGQILSVYQTLTAATEQRENNELARDKALNDKKKTQYQRQLDSKQISQQEYDRKIESMDNATAAKERAFKKAQFERDKTAKIIQANMQIAQSVLQALSSAPPPYSFILAAAVAAAGAIQLLTIKNSKAPEYGDGGLLRGPKHNSRYKGLPVVNPETGSVQAYLEGDEGILKRTAMYDRRQYTATGTPSQIASAFNSMHGGVNWEQGARVSPAWMSYAAKPVNFSGINSTLSNVRTFATGGRYTADAIVAPTTAAPITDPEMKMLLLQNTTVLSQLKDQLSAGIQAFVILKQMQTEQDRAATVRDAATFKR